MKKKIAFFPGRFQPLHKGHVHAIKQLLKKYNLVVGIGSVNKKDKNNPYSYEQRKKMIEVALKKYSKKFIIIPLIDFADNRKWTREVERRARFDVVVSGNNIVRYCFRKYGSRKYIILYPPFLKPRIYDASRIRFKIKRKLRWQNLVPKKIIVLIKRWW